MRLLLETSDWPVCSSLEAVSIWAVQRQVQVSKRGLERQLPLMSSDRVASVTSMQLAGKASTCARIHAACAIGVETRHVWTAIGQCGLRR